VRLALAIRSEPPFGEASAGQMGVGELPCPDSYRDCFFFFKEKEEEKTLNRTPDYLNR
jgi:hypothetical protein